ncbi:ABC transporter permease [Arthrobacter sp. MYb227]|uniref:ABC transporter permease n=1 Tax=Arthrobacter sp. MYb227 TaxID=1848601 RepID=UPI000CFB1616|nr:ABC transporter permease [Arthrobacter sp. MYb227]PQZ89081.1 ABC transporter permease [Arthrobacter sp. MYb227]
MILAAGTTKHIRRGRGREIISLLSRRFMVAIPATMAVTAGVFWLASIAPFNPLAAYLGSAYEQATPAQREALAQELGLNDTWYSVWFRWIGDALSGDWGTSRLFAQPVATVLSERLGYTVLLTGAGLILAIALSILLALGAGLRPGGILDTLCLSVVHIAQAIPPFVLGLVAIAVFALSLGLPAGGIAAGGAEPTGASVALHLVLPACVLAITLLPWLVMNLRASVLQELASDAVLAARGRGFGRRQILLSQVLPVASLPFITVVGTRLGELVTGALLIEVVFSWPGLASATVDSAIAGDFPLLAAVTALTCLMVFAGSALADACYLAVDPRVHDV